MASFFSKLISGFSYGAGFILAVACAIFAAREFINGPKVTSSAVNVAQSNGLKDIGVENISKFSSFTNYVSEGRKEEFIFSGKLKNNSPDTGYSHIYVSIDIYDKDGKFVYKCGGWDGVGLSLAAQASETFQKTCHQMPQEVVRNYGDHKVVIRQRQY